jgi:hypothetical protein
LRFTVRRPASAEVSPCCHRPSGGDVACCVHVGVARSCGAGFALENRLALTVLGRDVPESLMLQTRSEQTPTTPADSSVQTAFLSYPHTRLRHRSPRTAGHRTHVKGFDADRVEAPRDFSSDLFDPVLAPVSVTRFELRDRQLRSGSPVGAALGAGEALLQHLDPLGLTAAQARGVHQFTGRQCRRHGNTAVDTHHAAHTRSSDGSRHVGKRDMPSASPVAGDAVGLHAVRDRPRQAEAHPADLGHPHTTDSAVQTLDVMRFYRDLPEPLMHTGFAPCRGVVGSGEKGAHRLSEIPQRLLLHGLRAGRQPVVRGTGRGQLSTLLVIARRTATRLPMLLLFDGQVPHIPGVATVLGQHRLLLSGRKQPETRHTGNVDNATDKSPKGEAGLFPMAIARGLHAATTR